VKNPTALQDDFWHLFINIWTLGCSVISQFVYIILPGKSPSNYYLCIGDYPIGLHGIKVKHNIPNLISILLSVIAFLCARLANKKAMQGPESHNSNKNTQSLFTFTTYGVSIMLAFLLSYIPTKVNLLEGE
jgi:hypothetical protein